MARNVIKSLKRGWVPSIPEPSQATTSAASSRGYLDTPAKYRDMACEDTQTAAEDLGAELPPAKRRRTLAGSIVSTALSAALIGTAVGLTVYRLWRDRGKESEQLPPPPPYQQGDWVPPHEIQVTPPTPKSRKTRHTPASAKRPTIRHRKTRTRTHAITPPRSSSPALVPPPQPEFDFSHVDPIDQEEDEMDWIGGKLSQLIQEGQKALQKEVVVMSDSKEDEVDDGSGAWEEVDQATAGPSSRRGSIRRSHKPRNIPIPPSYSSSGFASPQPSASPRKSRFNASVTSLHSPSLSGASGFPIPSTPRQIPRGPSVESDMFGNVSSSFREDESAWQSPEIRESMEKARARFLQNRG
ncbi:hypothetical protein SERLA73DRAFT_143163 [Serpula lacrymans var. lacrymans S7.3]|uniref:Uncharacterized protein n=1 Tax=Serpula lacrymans var. lacrymans (strain S7.3) TaxID=936435 RepID=F8Q946_SERL3|nr:hypothetical protein SERLA73DRAFT_143163 [Serpula lacrymans var. lacrymans S7.3]